jgi:hypothetical protein
MVIRIDALTEYIFPFRKVALILQNTLKIKSKFHHMRCDSN